MSLRIGFELRDFDLERIGFSLSVLDAAKKRQISECYLQMSLEELGAFVNALEAAADEIDLTVLDGEARPPLIPTMPKTWIPSTFTEEAGQDLGSESESTAVKKAS